MLLMVAAEPSVSVARLTPLSRILNESLNCEPPILAELLREHDEVEDQRIDAGVCRLLEGVGELDWCLLGARAAPKSVLRSLAS